MQMCGKESPSPEELLPGTECCMSLYRWASKKLDCESVPVKQEWRMASVSIWVSAWSVEWLNNWPESGYWCCSQSWGLGMGHVRKRNSCRRRMWGLVGLLTVLSKTLRILFLAFSPIRFFPSSNRILFLIYKAQHSLSGDVWGWLCPTNAPGASLSKLALCIKSIPCLWSPGFLMAQSIVFRSKRFLWFFYGLMSQILFRPALGLPWLLETLLV